MSIHLIDVSTALRWPSNSRPATQRTELRSAAFLAWSGFSDEGMLCCSIALGDFLNGDFSPENIEETGEYFGASELAVKSHLANHRQIPFDSATV
jgi:hypothetical protein